VIVTNVNSGGGSLVGLAGAAGERAPAFLPSDGGCDEPYHRLVGPEQQEGVAREALCPDADAGSKSAAGRYLIVDLDQAAASQSPDQELFDVTCGLPIEVVVSARDGGDRDGWLLDLIADGG
jgi:hypothetical protein